MHFSGHIISIRLGVGVGFFQDSNLLTFKERFNSSFQIKSASKSVTLLTCIQRTSATALYRMCKTNNDFFKGLKKCVHYDSVTSGSGMAR